MPDLDIAKNLGARPDHDAVADLRVPVADLVAAAPERHVMQQGDVVIDHRGLADHKACGVIKKNAAADAGGGVNVALEYGRGAALQIIREILTRLGPQPMRQSMGLDRMEALEIQERLDEPAGGGVAIEGRNDVGAERFANRRTVLERIGIGL